MANQIPFVDELTQIMESLKSHKRYFLRSAAIVSILVGSTLNFVTLLAVFIGVYGGAAPKHLTAWTSIVLSVSFIWNLADLASHPDRIFKRKYLISVNFLVFVETLGFLGFLAILIANGIIVNNMYRGPRILMVYNSVPWMFCCAIHGLIALRNLQNAFATMGHGSTCCGECHHKANRQETWAKDGGYQPLLERANTEDGYQDLEANTTGDTA